jgi:hypothetical protein
MGCFYGLNYATACACIYGTSMLASMIYLWATIRGLSLLVTTSLATPAQVDLTQNRSHGLRILT